MSSYSDIHFAAGGGASSGVRGGGGNRLIRHESFARVDSPIHVILARDEEFGLGAGGEETRGTAVVGGGGDDESRQEVEEHGSDGARTNNTAAEDVQDEKWMPPPPPPAYGLWRGSRVSLIDLLMPIVATPLSIRVVLFDLSSLFFSI